MGEKRKGGNGAAQREEVFRIQESGFGMVTTNGANGQPGDYHTETRRHGGETEETRSEEMARRHNLRPVGGFLPEDREGWGLG